MRHISQDAAQCRKNISALLRHRNLPEPPLLVASPERVVYRYSREFESAVIAQARTGAWSPWAFGISLHDDGDPQTRALRGYREHVPFASCQLVIHGTPGSPTAIEADIDLGNPAWGDLASGGLHAGEFLVHTFSRLFRARGTTNPQRAARWLKRRGIEV